MQHASFVNLNEQIRKKLQDTNLVVKLSRQQNVFPQQNSFH